MEIYIARGVGMGRTTLSAFDSALQEAGVYNYNLIRLSSIIPPATRIVEVDKFNSPAEEYGHRLYAVMAEIRSREAGKYIAAGLGWYQEEDGRGVFVEHEIIGDTEVAVRSEIDHEINASLEDLCNARNFNHAKKLRSTITLARIGDKPTSALVIAVYQPEPWK